MHLWRPGLHLDEPTLGLYPPLVHRLRALAVPWSLSSVDEQLLEQAVEVGCHDVALVYFAEDGVGFGLGVEVHQLLDKRRVDPGGYLLSAGFHEPKPLTFITIASSPSPRTSLTLPLFIMHSVPILPSGGGR